jgi:hypothetical protein
VKVKVTGLTEPGQIGLVVQDSSGEVLAACDPVQIQENSSVQLRVVAAVSNGPAIRVFTPLYLGGSPKTDVLDMRSYRVIGTVAGSLTR